MIDQQDSFLEGLVLFFETKDPYHFNRFYNALYPLAFKVAILITKNSADAEDVAQTAFYIVFNQIEQCQSLHEKNSTKVKSWFLSIVYNQSKLVVRTRVRNRKKEQSQRIAANVPTSSGQQISPQLEQKLKQAIDTLDEKYRTPIILKYNEGLKSTEIAQILSLNEETLRVRIRRGLAKVRQLLATDQHEFEELLLPAIAFINFDHQVDISSIPEFANKDFIKKRYANPKSSYLIYKMILVLASFAGIFWLYQQIKITESPLNTTVTLEQPTQQKATEKRFWDLRTNQPTDLKIGGHHKWKFSDDGMSTEGLKFPETILLILPLKPVKHFKVKLMGKLEFGKTTESIGYVAQGIYFHGNQPVLLKDRVVLPVNRNIQPNSGKFEYGKQTFPFEAIVYFTQNYISSRFNQKPISDIAKIESNSIFDTAGLLLRGFKVQSIEYIPISSEEVIDVESEIQKNLANPKFEPAHQELKKALMGSEQ